MTKFFENNKDIGILILRITIGIAFAFIYGKPKLEAGPQMWQMLGGALGNFGIHFAPTFWGFMAMLAEFGGGILLILGLFTRPVVCIMAFNMIVAASAHLSKLDPWYSVITPINMLAIFICLLFIGAGKYSLDYLFFKRKKMV